jgi:tetratricopeptide (TPR) repeat protein
MNRFYYFIQDSILLGVICLCVAISVSALGQASAGTEGGLESLIQQGQALASANRLAEAEVVLTQAATIAPEDSRAITLLAKVKSRLGETHEAAMLFRSVVASQPSSATAHLSLSIALADLGQYKNALSEVDEAIRLNPKDPRAYLNRARFLADSGKVEEARAAFIRVDRIAPHDAEVKLFWGLFEKDVHRPQVAQSLLAQAVSLQPDNMVALLALADLQQSSGKMQSAIATWKHIVAIDPKSEKALYTLSLDLRDTDPAVAAQYLKKFTDLHDERLTVDHVTEMGNEAYSAMENQDWATAIAKLQDAITACGECALQADLHQRLGLADCHSGDLDAGERELRLSLSMNPNSRKTVEALQWVAEHRSQAPQN